MLQFAVLNQHKLLARRVNTLVKLGYIERIARPHSEPHRLGAYVYTIPNIVGKYFYVNRNIFKYKLKPAQMRMYLFFCKCADSKSKSFWQSFNDICYLLQLHRSAVTKTISELVSAGLIKKENIIKKDVSYSDNYYEIVDLSIPMQKIKRKIYKKKRRCCFALNIFSKSIIFNNAITNRIIIHQLSSVVNTFYKFFAIRGSPIILSSLYNTHFIPYSEEK